MGRVFHATGYASLTDHRNFCQHCIVINRVLDSQLLLVNLRWNKFYYSHWTLRELEFLLCHFLTEQYDMSTCDQPHQCQKNLHLVCSGLHRTGLLTENCIKWKAILVYVMVKHGRGTNSRTKDWDLPTLEGGLPRVCLLLRVMYGQWEWVANNRRHAFPLVCVCGAK
jgi:hypothetical protein